MFKMLVKELNYRLMLVVIANFVRNSLSSLVFRMFLVSSLIRQKDFFAPLVYLKWLVLII
jgi:hypothetical protein